MAAMLFQYFYWIIQEGHDQRLITGQGSVAISQICKDLRNGISLVCIRNKISRRKLPGKNFQEIVRPLAK